ncbi:YgfZ/GcvT domain-containing protein [Guyparkeria sp.]|uniref:CAF17-like 4Fe-4S cluster assembly/insertion protein YgfZ n=1 Tax=Guyparkeria sp. TaxID=2035736 RepID=UPI003970E973
MSDAIRQQWQAATQPPRDAMPPDGTTLVTGLVDREVIEVAGPEARVFLQAILTQDIVSLADDAATFCALCNAKGRALGLFRVVGHGDRFFLITRADIAPALQKRLQMYVLRRDVQIQRLEDWVALGVMLPEGRPAPMTDPAATKTLQRLAAPRSEDSPRWPARLDTDGLLYVREDLDGTPRIAIHGPIDRLRRLVESVPADSRVTASTWDRAEIEERIPLVDAGTVEHFVPQWINLDELGAFSLKKGCYPGQEVIARMHYLGKPNRRLFAGHALALDPPAAGTPVEATDGSTAGEVVRSAPLPDDSGSILLVVIKLKHLHDSLSIDGLALSIDQHGSPETEVAQAGMPH